MSNIEWTDRTWNPLRGCTKVSAGCDNCYAMGQAHRFAGPGLPYEGLTRKLNGRPQWSGKIRTAPHLLDQPIRWTKPRRIFVNSMSDLFHESVPFEFIADVFAVMSCTTRHTYQILTKRPERMLEWFRWAESNDDGFGGPAAVDPTKIWPQWTPYREGKRGGYDNCGPAWPLENVWIGVSVEDQTTADERIPLLFDTLAHVRWISAEPLLGPIDLSHYDGDIYSGYLDWVVAGGESGKGSRPAHKDWFVSLRDDCKAYGLPFFFKQWGDWSPRYFPNCRVITRTDCTKAYRVGKKNAGRRLDGRLHNSMPRGAA